MDYLHGISKLSECPRYTGDIITSCNCLQLLTIDNNSILKAARFMVYFLGIHFNKKNALYINFKKHDSIFCKAMLGKINGGGGGQ